MIVVFTVGALFLVVAPVIIAFDLSGSRSLPFQSVFSSALVLIACLVGVLLHTALILVFVDAGRNLRHINMRLARSERPGDRP